MDVSEGFLRQVSKHFVLLVCDQITGSPKQPEKRQIRTSCFVVEVEGHWLLVTAAHTIERYRAAEAHGARFASWMLFDTLFDDPNMPALPFPGELSKWIVLGGEHDSSGRDYAVNFIPAFVQRGVRAGGVRPIEAVAWEGIAPEHCDRWVLVGAPNEAEKDTQRLAMLLLDPCGPPAGTVATESPDRCFGRLSNLDTPGDAPVVNIGGMSGGPVFGVKMVDGHPRYWAIGVQSGWYEKARVAVFCPLQGFLVEVRNIVRDAMRQVEAASLVADGSEAL